MSDKEPTNKQLVSEMVKCLSRPSSPDKKKAREIHNTLLGRVGKQGGFLDMIPSDQGSRLKHDFDRLEQAAENKRKVHRLGGSLVDLSTAGNRLSVEEQQFAETLDELTGGKYV